MDSRGFIHQLPSPNLSTLKERSLALRHLAAEFGPLVLLTPVEEARLATMSFDDRREEYLRLKAERGAVVVERVKAIPSLKERRAAKKKTRAKRKAERARRKRQ